MEKTIYLIRHGAIDLKGEKRYIGTSDLPLSEEGVRQAGRLNDFFGRIDLDKVYCSHLQRSYHTACIIIKGKEPEIKPIVEKDFGEIHMGQWENKPFKDIQKQYPLEFTKRRQDILNFKPQGGESFLECYHRVINKLNEILLTVEGKILIVGHAGVNRLILCSILKMPLVNLFSIQQDYGCLNEITFEKSGFYRLKKMNCIY